MLFSTYLIFAKRCGGGGIIGSRVCLERRVQGRFSSSVDFLIGHVYIKLQSEWKGVSMYLPISLSLGKGFFSFTLSRLAICVETDE